jgi:hypothetical protein
MKCTYLLYISLVHILYTLVLYICFVHLFCTFFVHLFCTLGVYMYVCYMLWSLILAPLFCTYKLYTTKEPKQCINEMYIVIQPLFTMFCLVLSWLVQSCILECPYFFSCDMYVYIRIRHCLNTSLRIGFE